MSDVLIVIDDEILPHLTRYDKPYGIIPFWINKNNTKAIIAEKVLQHFIDNKTKERLKRV